MTPWLIRLMRLFLHTRNIHLNNLLENKNLIVFYKY